MARTLLQNGWVITMDAAPGDIAGGPGSAGPLLEIDATCQGMETRCRERLDKWKLLVNRATHGGDNGGNDAAGAGRAEHENRLAITQHEQWRLR